MKRWSLGASALGTLLVAVGMAVAAQEPRQDQTQEPRTTDQPQLSVAVPIPTTNPRVDLSTIFWNGEAKPLNPGGKPNIPSPASVGAAKTITITNSGPDMIYPFLRGQNGGSDPHASPV